MDENLNPEQQQEANATNDEMSETMKKAKELLERITSGDMGEKRKMIVDRLNTIRVAKTKILKHLQILKEKEESGEYSNLDLVQKLVESYDNLVVQEREFISLLREIIGTYREAINTVTDELNTLQKTCEKEPGENGKTEQKQLEGNISQELDELMSGFNAMEKTVEEVRKTSMLDEQFKTCVQLHFEKRRQLELTKEQMELRHKLQMKEKTAQELAAKELTERTKTKVVNERSSLDRKQKQLERLRKEAARRGLVKEEQPKQQNSSSATNSSSSSTKPNNNKIKPPAAGKQPPKKPAAKKEPLGPVIPENARIPIIPQIPVADPPSDASAEKKKDDLHSKISERFSSLESRKQRMRLLRMKLNNLEKQKMDNTYDEAVKRVKSLTEMRKKLEDVQLNMDKNGEEDNKSMDEKSATGAQIVAAGDKPSSSASLDDEEDDENIDNRSSVSTDELLNQVRRSFINTFKKFSSGNNANEGQKSASVEAAILALTDRLKHIEIIMHGHTEQLNWVANQATEACSSSSAAAAPLPPQPDNGHVAMDRIDAVVAHVAQKLIAKMAQDTENNSQRPISEQLGAEITDLVVAESARLYPREFNDRQGNESDIGVNFATIFGAIVSDFMGRSFDDSEQQRMVAELTDAMRSELIFLELMQNAKKLRKDEDEEQ